MTNRQFNFSLSVSVALIALGAVILGQASVGFSLMAMGAAIGVLALVNKAMAGGSRQPLRAPMQQNRMQDSATDY